MEENGCSLAAESKTNAPHKYKCERKQGHDQYVTVFSREVTMVFIVPVQTCSLGNKGYLGKTGKGGRERIAGRQRKYAGFFRIQELSLH